MYDNQNIFAKILRGEIPCNKILEGDHYLAFHDVAPQAKVHALVIPKGPYLNFNDFTMRANFEEIIALQQGIVETLKVLNLLENGYRLIANTNDHGGQIVPHYHVHILGGEKLSDGLVGR